MDSRNQMKTAMSVYAAFERSLYQEVVKDVRKHVPGVRLREAWVWKAGRDHWEFHYGEFFWHGSASGAFEARAKGWSAYLTKQGVEGYKLED